MKKLTILITFRNEGRQVFKTVRNLNSYSDPGLFDIICLDDVSDDGYDYSELEVFGNVRYIQNDERLGVAGNRDKGVAISGTDYVLLLDGHMRIFDNVITPLINYLDKYPRTLFCLQSKVMKEENGKIYVNQNTPVSRGARINFEWDKPISVLCSEWEYLRREDYLTDMIEIPCVLGAAYAIRKDYYLKLHGLNGLAQYGLDETLLSAKVWLEGGRCVLLRELEAGHLYRKKSPNGISRKAVLYNRMICAELLFPAEIRRQYYASIMAKPFYAQLRQYIGKILPAIREERCYLESIFCRTFNELLQLNTKEHADRIYPQ